MTTRLDRRQILAGTAASGVAGALNIAAPAAAQDTPKTRIAARIDRDLEVLDPGYRTGPWDGNVARSVFQRLMKQKPNSAELENDAAAEIKQSSPTTVDFTLKPGQMFTGGFGEMTADDVKFSF